VLQVVQWSQQREAGMVEQPDIQSLPDAQPDVDNLGGLADAPLTALGLSGDDADALEQALGVRSVRELADNKYVRRARQSCTWRTRSDHRDRSLSEVRTAPLALRGSLPW
jgi:hypothetical protein